MNPPLIAPRNPFITLIPLMLIAVPLAFVLRSLAKAKGRNAPLYFLLGLIPVVNALALAYLVGAPDLVLHAKMDRLLSELGRNRATTP